ncbi:MAG: EVE domain-containing protein [Calditrichaeota bacterium]|nr:MAG: EVE domain-containing protein [Calditrichota bacterium]
MAYWLLKSEPETYAWEDLKREPGRQTLWDGVRNYLARNRLKAMQVGDLAFFYHSGRQKAIMGIVRVVREAYPDPTQFDPASPYRDPKSSPENPRWVAVDVAWVRDFVPPITLDELKARPELADLELLQRGNRFSVQEVTPEQWRRICALRPD